jgi:hypothetical protein
VTIDATSDITFELGSFTREGDVFLVSGVWRAREDGPLGRPRLSLVGDGKRRRLTPTAKGPVQAGQRWQGRFRWTGAPADIDSAELELRDVVIELEAPGAPRSEGRFVRTEPREVTPDLLGEMRTLVEELRAEREALERARAATPPRRAVRRRHEPVDLGPWPQRIMAGGLAAFAVLVLSIALS